MRQKAPNIPVFGFEHAEKRRGEHELAGGKSYPDAKL